MDSEKFAKDYLRVLKSAVPEREFPSQDPSWLSHWETFLPEGMHILMKEEEWFSEPRECIPGVNFSEFWGALSDTDKDRMWRFIQFSVIHGVLEGNPTDSMGKVVDMFKSWWRGSGHEDDEVEKLLADEETPSQLKALLDAVMESRLVVIMQEVVGELDFKDLGIDVERPETLFDSIRDMESPLIQTLMKRVQEGLERRIQSGRISREAMIAEIERLRALAQQTFGKVLNEQIFGPQQGTGVPASVALGHGPEARRQRMLARLQKKVREKNSGDSTKR